MDTTSDIQNEQTPFTFRGDEQTLLTAVDRAVHSLPGRRIASRTYGGYLATDYLSHDDAAWEERSTEGRRLRVIWIGDARSMGAGSIGYRCAYVDRPDDATPEWIHMWLAVKLATVLPGTVEGVIEAPDMLRFAVDAILKAIEKAGREVRPDAPTGDTPSESVDQDTPSAGKQAGDSKRQRNASTDAKVREAHRLLKGGEYWKKVKKTCAYETYIRHCFDVTGEEPITK